MGKTRAWLLYALAWVPIAGLYAAALMQEIPPARAIEGGIVAVAVAALLGVGVWHLTGRIPWRSDSIPRFLVLHGLLAVAFVAVWVTSIYGRLAVRGGMDLVRHVASQEGGWNAIVGLWIYGLLVGGSYAIRTEERARRDREAAVRAEALRALAEAERARAELRALRTRLEPHFLFNTLHTIRGLVRQEPEQACVGIEILGDLLRYVLGLDERESERVSLEEEIAFTRGYLALERLRLGDRLRVEESIDENALDSLIPALTLQPLVENAVRHGISPRARGGTIRIRVGIEGTRLLIVVEDDGVGANPAEADEAAGLGLRTVRQRLSARYNGLSDFAVRTSPGGGFRVDVGLPLEHRAAEA
jgi:sensor histidine kinase YesM